MGRLFLRIFLWFWLGSTCLLLVLAVGLRVVQPDILVSLRFIGQSGILYIGVQAANAYEEAGEQGASTLLADIRRETGFSAWLYSDDRRLLSGESPMEDARDMVARAMANDDVVRSARLGPIVFARRIASRSGNQYVILLEAPFRLSDLVSPLQLSIRIVVLALTGGVVCLWLTWQITKPIRTLRTTAGRFAQGDLTVRIGDKSEFKRGDELSELAHDFDYMAARIDELMKSQQQLLADISHELRSPLARLSLALDLARRRLGDVPEHQRMDREIYRLNELIEQLLVLARLQEQSKRPQSESLNMRDLVYEVAADATFEAEAARRKVVVVRDCNASVQGSRALLRSALENVVRNAVRHTPEGTEVTISMELVNGTTGGGTARGGTTGGATPAGPHRLRIAVRDRGPGVPVRALDRLFDPFFRVDEGRDRKSGGVGLGLAITRQAMLTHGGTASAQNHPEGGLLIRLELPI